MKIGVSLTSAYPLVMEPRQAGRNLIERAAAVRRAGLDSLFVGDYHVTQSHYFQNVPLLGRLLAEVGDLPVGALFVLPLFHPVLLAEQIGTLAALAEGPFTLVTGMGDGEQFPPFGVSLKERPSRLVEGQEIIRRLLAGERVTHSGRHYTLDDVAIHPTPPEPVPIWVSATARPAVQLAAVIGDGWLAGPWSCGEDLITQANIYRQACDVTGRTPYLAIRRDVYVGESDREAEEATARVVAAGYRSFDREAMVIGGPDTVVAEFRRLHDLGFRYILVRHLVLKQDLVLASYRRLGSEVLPAVRDL
ncbi:MAG: LLM class flavin-dependent oxidoreductase [Dehalococcoidia bacterium]